MKNRVWGRQLGTYLFANLCHWFVMNRSDCAGGLPELGPPKREISLKIVKMIC